MKRILALFLLLSPVLVFGQEQVAIVNAKPVVGHAVRTAVAAADAAGSLASSAGSIAVDRLPSVQVDVTFSGAGATTSVFLALYDKNDVFLGATESNVFTASAYTSDGTRYASARYIYDVGTAAKVRPIISAISAGNVTLWLRPL